MCMCGYDLSTPTGLAAFSARIARNTQRRPAPKSLRPVRVRKIRGWWVWYCQLPYCLDFSPRIYRDPGRAADAGREHHRLWHADELPIGEGDA